MSPGRRPGALTLSQGDRRLLAVWVADCAERVLPLFELAAPDDPRPRDAISGVRSFALGDLRIGKVRALAVAAHAAARSVRDPAAVAAARAAGHAAATAHMAAHARGVPAYASIAAGEGELRWALGHASPAVRDVLRRLPSPPAAGGALGAAICDLHATVMAGDGPPSPAR